MLLELDKRPISPSIIFEAGLAQGMGVPVALLDGREALFGSEDSEELALDTLLVAPRLYARIANRTGLVHELSAYLDGLQETPDAVIGDTFTAVKRSSTAGRRSKTQPSHWTALERRVAQAIEHAGGTLVTDPPKHRVAPDLVCLFPQLDASMNPVLVEIKQTRQIDDAYSQLVEALNRANAHLGILVALDRVPTERRRVGPLQVVTQVSVSDLEDDPDHLVKLLTEARNLAVHG